MLRRHLSNALACTALLIAGQALAQATAPKWPDKTVRIVAAGPAGGSADIVARLLADALSRQIGQPVIVEPKPGAGGVLAVNELSQAARDGHTLLVGVNSLVSEIPHILKLPVVMANEIKPLAEVARGGLVMVGHNALPAKTLPELVAHVKAQPGKVNFASYTAGTISHVMGLQLNSAAGIDMTHVGYKGSTPALQDRKT
jgi:tripartite-type tricarboxylate transporter receptor subunit TctC